MRESLRRAALASAVAASVLAAGAQSGVERRDGGIVRGPSGEARIALVFTGHEFGEGGPAILDALARRGLRASFFLTGDFLRTPAFAPVVARIVRDGHYLGPHSDKHLLYCGWDAARPTLVTRDAFTRDLEDNLRAIEAAGVARAAVRHWLPAYEWYNAEIAAWGERAGLALVTFTPGTRSNADYTGEADRNFVPSQRIVDSILTREREDPRGLNGFILLLHVGSGPGRADKMHDRVGELLSELSRRHYRFVRIDELLREGGRP